MDKIKISNIIVQAVIGVYSFEQSIKQTLSIDLQLQVDAARAALHDDINDTHNYAEIYAEVVSFVDHHPCQLIETLAEKLAAHIKNKFQMKWLRISIAKQPQDMPQETAVSVVIER